MVIKMLEKFISNRGNLDSLNSYNISTTINYLEFYSNCPYCNDEIEHSQIYKHIRIHHFDTPDFIDD